MLPKSSRPEVINRGIGGEDIDDMVARLQADVLAKKPDMVIWQIGSNDPMRAVPLDRFEDETRAGIAAIRAAGSDVMLMEPQWCPKLEGTPGANLFRDKVREIGAALDVPVIRRAELMHRWIDEGRLTQAQMIADDGLHMRDGGYALLARDVAARDPGRVEHRCKSRRRRGRRASGYALSGRVLDSRGEDRISRLTGVI